MIGYVFCKGTIGRMGKKSVALKKGKIYTSNKYYLFDVFPDLVSALCHASGTILYKIETDEASYMKCLTNAICVHRYLFQFAHFCILSVAHLWDMPLFVREYFMQLAPLYLARDYMNTVCLDQRDLAKMFAMQSCQVYFKYFHDTANMIPAVTTLTLKAMNNNAGFSDYLNNRILMMALCVDNKFNVGGIK